MSEKMNPEVKARWVAALRSGEYEQGVGKLKAGDGMCCLGVLCDLHAKAHGGQWERVGPTNYYVDECNYLPPGVMTWAGLPERTGTYVSIKGAREKLPVHNDDGKTFAEIADAIEAQL